MESREDSSTAGFFLWEMGGKLAEGLRYAREVSMTLRLFNQFHFYQK